jgi:hypothetical protein
MYILLIVFPLVTFSIVVDKVEDCLDYFKSNQAHWTETQQRPMIVCRKTTEV